MPRALNPGTLLSIVLMPEHKEYFENQTLHFSCYQEIGLITRELVKKKCSISIPQGYDKIKAACNQANGQIFAISVSVSVFGVA